MVEILPSHIEGPRGPGHKHQDLAQSRGKRGKGNTDPGSFSCKGGTQGRSQGVKFRDIGQ